MNCNCNNINGSSTDNTQIRVVYGNVLRLAIPLTVRTVEIVDGEIEFTDTDFIPSSDYPVNVVLSKVATKIHFEATMQDGNVAYFEDKGTIPVGKYDITVTCKDDDGNPYRFNQRTVIEIVNSTIDAGIEQPIEYEVNTWYLNAALYLALKGKDGVGIFDIQIQQSDVVGGENIVTFILTDGTTHSFSVLNGAGSVDDIFDTNSPYPISNRTVSTKFNQIDQYLSSLFGNVEYNSTNKSIVFYNKDRTRILATIDARPFIKDGMVSNVYISNNTLVITFNTDSGREAIGVPLSSVFNPNNYYNKTQVDSKIAQAIAGIQIDTSGFAQLNDYSGKLTYSQAPIVILDFIDGVSEEAGEVGFGTIYGASNGRIMYCDEYTNLINIGYSPSIIFYNIAEDGFYRFKSAQGVWERIGSYDSGSGTFVQEQVDWDETDTTKPTFIKNKPTLFSGSYNDLTDKPTFNEMFAGVVYDSQTRRINFYGKGDVNHTTVLAYIDASPFIVDGMLSNVEVKNVTINGSSVPCFVFSFNTDSGKQNINIPTSSIFNAANYYTKAEIDNKGYLTIQANPDWEESDTTSPSYIQNKPTIHDNGIESITTQQDGVISIYLSNGDIYTIDLNHSHTQYVESSQLANVATSGSYNDLSDKPTILTKVQVSGNTPTQAMTSGLFYEFTGSLTSLTLTLTAPSSGLGVYAGKFTSDSTTATTLSVPASVVEASGNPTITVGKTYEFSIVDDVLLMFEV